MTPLLLLAMLSRIETPPDVARFLDSFVEAFENLDWDRFRDHFSDEATVFFPAPYGGQRATGRAEVEAGFQRVFERWKKERPGPPYLEIQPLDLMVQTYGEIHVVTFHLNGGESLSRRTLVLGREGGELKILHLHASSQ
jgi:ketosteroid isomerase-like protein